ncbi:MAG: polyphosphate kinase 1 [Acidimicrobiia bacterium]|nr:polyphosphate kinase 1 [Acidimicrobiia bacterium]
MQADSTMYLNRELSWLEFNARVLEEAQDTSHPLLERVKFLSIFHTNLDEFFMIRVSGLRRQLNAGVLEAPPDGMTPAEQLTAIRQRLEPDLSAAMALWEKDLMPALSDHDIKIVTYEQLDEDKRKRLRRHFKKDVFPVLTPLAFDPGHPFPHISNLSLNLAVDLRHPTLGQRFARVKVPGSVARLVRVPAPFEGYEGLDDDYHEVQFVWLEEVITANLDLLFPGTDIDSVHPFRITRDADVEIEEDEASDLLVAVEEGIDARRFGNTIRLEVHANMPDHLREILVHNLDVAPFQIYELTGPLGLSDVIEVASIDRQDLKDPPFVPKVPPMFELEESVFSLLQRRDIFLYHPYDSFLPVVDFIRAAAHDPQVVTIKQTLYRVGGNSPIVEALLEARENDKQVAVMLELKARFDEENNIEWARALEQAGVHVVYGVAGLKTHAKMALVVRKEADALRRYVHLSTGNYNVSTSRVYTDIGLLTSDPDIAKDVNEVFNSITGYGVPKRFRKLLVAPGGMKDELLARIDREIELHKLNGNGYLGFKMNALVDRDMIDALYRASMAGVIVDLQVRGICCLRPGVEGLSDNITVTSVVGRFLEHTRIYYFDNGGDSEIFLGSADLMPRNLEARVEVLFPIEDPRLKAIILDEVLRYHLSDNTKARLMRPDGTYVRRKAEEGEALVDSQAYMLSRRGTWSPD